MGKMNDKIVAWKYSPLSHNVCCLTCLLIFILGMILSVSIFTGVGVWLQYVLFGAYLLSVWIVYLVFRRRDGEA